MSGPAFSVARVELEDRTTFRLATVLTHAGEVLHFSSVYDLRAWAVEEKQRLFSYGGGSRDFVHLLQAGPLQSVALAGAGILSAQCGKTWIHDTSKLLPDSLGKLGRFVGLPRDADRPELCAGLFDGEVRALSERDCEIQVLALLAHREWAETLPGPRPADRLRARWPATAGASAIYALETLEPDHVAHLRAHPLDPDTWADHHDAGLGGRTEIWFLGHRPVVNVFDVRSSYPRAWLDAPVPVGPWVRVAREHPGQGVYFCQGVKQPRTMLPAVMLNHGARYEGRGWLTSEEIATVREAGGDLRVEWGFVSEVDLPLCQRVVGHLYPLKAAGKPWGKSVLNAMAGKFTQDLMRDTYFHTPEGYVRDRELCLPRWFNRPLIGAVVYARARLRLWRILQALRSRGWEVYYCDTDSVHTNCPPSQFPGIIGTACGEWQVEHEAVEAIYCGPKFYGLRKGGRLAKVACSGFGNREITWDTLIRVAKGEEILAENKSGLVGFRSAAQSWSPEEQDHFRTLRTQTGGKKRLPGGWLAYA